MFVPLPNIANPNELSPIFISEELFTIEALLSPNTATAEFPVFIVPFITAVPAFLYIPSPSFPTVTGAEDVAVPFSE